MYYIPSATDGQDTSKLTTYPDHIHQVHNNHLLLQKKLGSTRSSAYQYYATLQLAVLLMHHK